MRLLINVLVFTLTPKSASDQDAAMTFAQLPPSHPVYILYSSGRSLNAAEIYEHD